MIDHFGPSQLSPFIANIVPHKVVLNPPSDVCWFINHISIDISTISHSEVMCTNLANELGTTLYIYIYIIRILAQFATDEPATTLVRARAQCSAKRMDRKTLSTSSEMELS